MPHIDEAQVHAYLDGECTAAERVKLEGHVKECEPCRALIEEAAATKALASQLIAELAPEVERPSWQQLLDRSGASADGLVDGPTDGLVDTPADGSVDVPADDLGGDRAGLADRYEMPAVAPPLLQPRTWRRDLAWAATLVLAFAVGWQANRGFGPQAPGLAGEFRASETAPQQQQRAASVFEDDSAAPADTSASRSAVAADGPASRIADPPSGGIADVPADASTGGIADAPEGAVARAPAARPNRSLQDAPPPSLESPPASMAQAPVAGLAKALAGDELEGDDEDKDAAQLAMRSELAATPEVGFANRRRKVARTDAAVDELNARGELVEATVGGDAVADLGTIADNEEASLAPAEAEEDGLASGRELNEPAANVAAEMPRAFAEAMRPDEVEATLALDDYRARETMTMSEETAVGGELLLRDSVAAADWLGAAPLQLAGATAADSTVSPPGELPDVLPGRPVLRVHYVLEDGAEITLLQQYVGLAAAESFDREASAVAGERRQVRPAPRQAVRGVSGPQDAVFSVHPNGERMLRWRDPRGYLVWLRGVGDEADLRRLAEALRQ